MGGGGMPGQYAEVGPRIIAGLIDFVAPTIAVYVVIFVLSAISSTLGLLSLLLYFALFGFYLWNTGYTQGETGQSIGKKTQNIKVVSEETGQPIGGTPGIIRSLVHFVDGFCWAGYIYGLFISPKKQTVADIVGKTVVVPA